MTRLEILKTYKLYIGGKFPRTESGRYYSPEVNGEPLGNICLSSRKDFRNAMVAARAAQTSWANRTAYNRSQILYRIGEMLETRRGQFVEELIAQGATKVAANKEVDLSVDRLIHYAGWCDKYQQIFSSVNPVASSHFNFSVLEPMGVVFLFAEEQSSLLGLASMIAPIIAGGNTVICLASESKPLCSVTFAEVLHSSDVPGGVINILTGNSKELMSHIVKHMDLNAIAYCRGQKEEIEMLQKEAASNLKRVRVYDKDWSKTSAQDPYLIRDFNEVKTTWHPIEHIGASGSGY